MKVPIIEGRQTRIEIPKGTGDLGLSISWTENEVQSSHTHMLSLFEPVLSEGCALFTGRPSSHKTAGNLLTNTFPLLYGFIST